VSKEDDPNQGTTADQLSGELPEQPAVQAPSYRASMQFACPRCESEFHCAVGRPIGAEEDAVPFALPSGCPACEWEFEGRVVEERAETQPDIDQPISACVVCGNEEFYVQKDFNRQLGFWVVLISFTIIFLVQLIYGHLWGLYCLFALAVIDYLAYRSLRNVTVCYLCHTIYRGFPLGAEQKGFYLGSEEKHKHLRKTWLEKLTEEKS